MKRICLAATLISIAILSGWVSAEPKLLELDGREVVVRVWRNKERQDGYKKITATVKGRVIKLKRFQTSGWTSFQMYAEDQEDVVLQEYLEGNSCGWVLSKVGWEYFLPLSQAEVSGREVTVRFYQCGGEDPEAFTRKPLKLNSDRVEFDFDDADANTWVVIFGQEQQDELVRRVLGNRVYGWPYKKGLEIWLLQELPSDEQANCDLTFVDGLAEPIAHADVKIYLTSKDKRVLIGKKQLGEDGRLTGIPCRGKVSGWNWAGTRPAALHFDVSHPDYGSAFVEQTYKDVELYYVPLVRRGSEADKRSIWGRVVDSKGQPVGGATICGIAITTLGDDWIRSMRNQEHGVTTDVDGRYRMYLPPSEEAYQVGPMIPPKTKYHVSVKPPAGSNLLRVLPEIMNGQSTEIVLEYGEHFHTFAFEDSNGIINDANVLKDIRVVVRRPGKHSDVWFRYKRWKEGARLPLGRCDARHREYRFQSLEVTADSPERLIFQVKAPKSKTYRGRGVNGITDEPMGGAFVVASGGCSGRSSLAWLSTTEWAKLHKMQRFPPTGKGPKLQSTEARGLPFDCASLVRSDVEGRFEVNLPAGTEVERFIVFEEDYLAYHLPMSWAREDSDGVWVFPEARLFPAAKVSVRPDFAVDPNRRPMLGLPGWFLMGPQWFVDKEKSPAWAEKLLAACGEEADEGLFRGNRLGVIPIQGDYRPHRFLVPAGVSLQLNLRSVGSVEWAPITVGEDIKLEQGQLMDLGRHKIVEPFGVFVEVLNSAGTPVEGVPVMVCGGYDPAVSSSDEEGIAIFEFVGYSKGEFVVECDTGGGADKSTLREATAFKISGPEDANSIHTLEVSDELLYHLFK